MSRSRTGEDRKIRQCLLPTAVSAPQYLTATCAASLAADPTEGDSVSRCLQRLHLLHHLYDVVDRDTGEPAQTTAEPSLKFHSHVCVFPSDS